MTNRNIQKQIKEEWIEHLQKVDDINLLENLSHNYITILKSLNIIEHQSKKLQSEHNERKEEKHNPIYNETSDWNINVYTFQRRLKGGIGIQEIDGEKSIELVPERIVREHGLESGDKIKIKKHAYGNNKHLFAKQYDMEKAEVENYPIISYNNALVDYDDTLKMFVIKGYYHEDGYRKLPTLIIKEDDIQKYYIEVGDIVDVAHLPDRSSVVIRWKYSTDEKNYNKPQKASIYKEKTSDDKADKQLINSPIANKTIGIVGANNYVVNYKKEVEQRNGILLSTESVQRKQIEDFVNQCDLVVIPIFNVSHIKMDLAKSSSNKLKVPYIILRNTGKYSFINEIEKELMSHDK